MNDKQENAVQDAQKAVKPGVLKRMLNTPLGLIGKIFEAKLRLQEKEKDRYFKRLSAYRTDPETGYMYASPRIRGGRKNFGPGETSRMRRAKEGKKPW